MSVIVSWSSITDTFIVSNSNEPDFELEFTRAEWTKFLRAVKRGELDNATQERLMKEKFAKIQEAQEAQE